MVTTRSVSVTKVTKTAAWIREMGGMRWNPYRSKKRLWRSRR
jgi:hypothetical protein